VTNRWPVHATYSDALQTASGDFSICNQAIRFTPINGHLISKPPSHIERQRQRKSLTQGRDSAPSVPTSTFAKGTALPLLEPRAVLPDSLCSLFSFRFFNAMQSKAFAALYNSDKNLVISAPTGCGKTVCFELAIARLIVSKFILDGFKVRQPEEAVVLMN